MLKSNQKIKYILYTRKSTESEDKQIQSLDDQIKELKKLASRNNQLIVEILQESKSAKKPNNRPEFNRMIEKLEAGEVDGILCWQVNRLSRNPAESGMIQQLLQDGLIKSIQTIDHEYKPDDNALLFCLQGGLANVYIQDLSKNVKRGLESKINKGWWPSIAPPGYLNSKSKEKGENDIILDPERFNLIRKMWDMMLTGAYTVPQILKIVNETWGFKTPKTRKRGGGELSRTSLFDIFNNIFYTGLMEYTGIQYEGKHKPMISLEEYDQVQYLLGKKGKQRPKTHHFPYTGTIRCEECGCLITAITKTKFIKSVGKLKHYSYYHCTRKKKHLNCSQKKEIKAENLDEQIEREIESLTILPEFVELAREILKNSNDKEVETRSNIYETQHKTLVANQKQLDKLLDMKLQDQISDEEYAEKRNLLINQIKQLKDELRHTEQRAEDWHKKTEMAFDFAARAHNAFLNGNIQTKKEILLGLGLNFTLKDGKLNIQGCPWLVPFKNEYKPIEENFKRLELPGTSIYSSEKEKERILDSLNPEIYPQPDLNRCYRRERAMS